MFGIIGLLFLLVAGGVIVVGLISYAFVVGVILMTMVIMIASWTLVSKIQSLLFPFEITNEFGQLLITSLKVFICGFISYIVVYVIVGLVKKYSSKKKPKYLE